MSASIAQELPSEDIQRQATSTPPVDRGLRLWPGLAIAVLTTAAIAGMPYLSDNVFARFMTMFFGPMIATGLVAVWWLFASRAWWGDRLLFPLLFALAAGIGYLLAHETFRMGIVFYGLWGGVVAWPVWLLLSRAMPMRPRRIGFAVVMLAVFAACGLFRLDGVDGSIGTEISWRFSPTAEDRYLAERAERSKDAGAVVGGELEAKAGDWVGFRGAQGDGVAAGEKLSRTDWSESAPRQVWKQRVGPGWSSCVIVGDRLFTQEQQGEAEAVVCYEASTGKEVWSQRDEERFTEVVSGAGPRATPAFHEGRIYTLGAKGKLHCFDAARGTPLWKADIVQDSGAEVPVWGFAASPCVAAGLVSVYAGGKGKAVVAYDAKTGQLAWAKGEGGHGYASTQRATLAGKEVLLVASGPGLIGLDPKTGETVLDYPWPMQEGMARCVQTPTVGADEVLFGSGFGMGTRRVKFKVDAKGKLVGTDVWETRAISPYFNDLVIFKGHAYGFDGEFLTCIDLEDGSKKWRQRGYGNGQVLLLPAEGLVLVQAEKTGIVALVEASPEGHRLKGKFKWTEAKTWNHPVLAHGRLYLRNAEEMACYEVGKP